ncbi:Fungal specific transcription factor domain [Rhizoctonia solani]|uniref:Fungal specific transcription factor domain n=1 Tax=Rhizoctonia solani TaxID=456999 RepID=A0A8H7M428_9AGAM|nr:Fungal specific transcription factor domain [Rhizoctonia solani]
MPRMESQIGSSSSQPTVFLNLKRNQVSAMFYQTEKYLHTPKNRHVTNAEGERRVIGKANESNLNLSDAQKPCSTCVKSHRFAAFGNPDLLQVEPECTYDNIVSEGNVVKHRTKYQVWRAEYALGGSSNPSLPEVLDPLAFLPLDQFNAPSETQSTVPLSNDSEQQLTISGWPIRLPKPDLFYHLVDVFFTSYPHAHYIIHRPSFMLSLALSPKSPDFRMCPSSTPSVPMLVRPDTREISFAEMHTQWARKPSNKPWLWASIYLNVCKVRSLGRRRSSFLVNSSIFLIVSSCGRRWDVLRVAVPLGLNSRTGFRGDGTAHLSETPETLLPDPTNCVEEETRVNLFWVAYANERLSESPGSWAMCLDDQDIHQVVPGDLLHFEAGHDIQGERQTLESPDLLIRHFPEHSDGFTLYIKATILVSKVKSFNLRIRFKYPKATDLRELVEFQELEQSVASFR